MFILIFKIGKKFDLFLCLAPKWPFTQNTFLHPVTMLFSRCLFM